MAKPSGEGTDLFMIIGSMCMLFLVGDFLKTLRKQREVIDQLSVRLAEHHGDPIAADIIEAEIIEDEKPKPAPKPRARAAAKSSAE